LHCHHRYAIADLEAGFDTVSEVEPQELGRVFDRVEGKDGVDDLDLETSVFPEAEIRAEVRTSDGRELIGPALSTTTIGDPGFTTR